MQSSYNPWMVALSLGVAILASYTALDLSGRILLVTEPRRRLAWLIGGALAMGVGIWSMHFIGMLAFSLPIPLGYDLSITVFSLAIAIAVSFFALSVVQRESLSLMRLGLGGLLMGAGIAGMHYTGMAAMRMDPVLMYHPGLFAASIFIAIAASVTALWIAHSLTHGDPRFVTMKRFGAAAVMGIAITGMHYTGMAAAIFPAGAMCRAASGIDAAALAATISALTFALLVVTLLLSRFDASKAMWQRTVTRLDGQLARLNAHDPLTDLFNRKTLGVCIERAIGASKRSGHLFALILMDIDGFKNVNDSLGHSVGDALLKAFARRLQDCVRRSDTVARLGGDEFVILVENLASPDDAREIAEGIISRMQESLWAGDVRIRVTQSIGIVLYPGDGLNAETLLKNADAAMYGAKHAGRNTYRFFEEEMNASATRALVIQQVLHDALADELFYLEFQPKFLRDGQLAGAEALLRLQHPKVDVLAPGEFIPVAERSGQIVQIGYWVVRESCRQLRRWADEGLLPVTIAINLSSRQFVEDSLAARMLSIVESEGVSVEHIMFEITESAAMENTERTAQMIEAFHTSGFQIALDDFGTGHSSLAYLQRFRVKQLKIDRFFVDGLDRNGDEGHAIVSAIIAVARSLRMDVVAEGVETRSQLDILNALMCDQLQGFFFARPLSPETFASLLREQGNPRRLSVGAR